MKFPFRSANFSFECARQLDDFDEWFRQIVNGRATHVFDVGEQLEIRE
jgi:hypothetical protein